MSDSKAALITGASSGIGAALARELAARKYDCVLAARRTDRLEALGKELEKAHGIRSFAVTSDLGVADGPAKLIEAVKGLGVTVEVLVNNAGFGVHGPFVDQPADRVRQMIELNLMSLTTLTHHYAKEMAGRRQGRILQVSSIGAFQASPLYAVYSATKAYVLSFSEAINYELHSAGVNVTTLCPGLTATEFHDVAEHPKPAWMKMITMTPEAVARIGLRGLFARRAVVTPGLVNWLTAQFPRYVPRSLGVLLADLSMRGEA